MTLIFMGYPRSRHVGHGCKSDQQERQITAQTILIDKHSTLGNVPLDVKLPIEILIQGYHKVADRLFSCPSYINGLFLKSLTINIDFSTYFFDRDC